jgi:hypothetical protein
VKRILKSIFYSIFCVVGLGLIAVFVFIQKPERFLTPERLSELAEKGRLYAAREKLASVHWQSLRIEIHSLSFFQKELTLKASQFCFKQTMAEGCLETLNFRVLAGLEKSFPSLPTFQEVGPIEIESKDLKLNFSAPHTPAPPSSKPSPPSAFSLPSWLASAQFKPIRVDLSPLEVKLSPQKSYQGQIEIETPAQAQSTQNELKLNLLASMIENKQNLKLAAEFGLSPGKVRSTLDLLATAKDRRLHVHDCAIELSSEHGSKTYRDLSVHCPLDVDLPAIPASLPKTDFPKQIALTIDSKINGSLFPFDPSQNLKGSLDLRMEPFETSVFKGRGEIDTQFNGKPKPGKLWPELWSGDLKTDINIALSIEHFQKLNRSLRGTPYEVPAPFAILKGDVTFKSKGAIDPAKIGESQLPFDLSSTLRAPTEDFVTQTKGEVSINGKEIRVDLDVLLSNIRIALPKISIAGVPRLTPDGRISRNLPSNKPQKRAAQSVHYSVHVHTPPQAPIRITSNLTQQAIPIGVDVSMTDRKPPSGKISIEPFPLKLFQRDVALKKFDLDLSQPIKNSTVDGLIDVNYVDYDIHVQVVNTVDKPKVILTSDPPLPDDEILSVLLFGNPPDELDADQTSSVGNTQAAITDGAIGLASLYTLASTPIQSVGYDPSTGTVTAKVKLGKGTSLNLGAQENQLAQTGIRQRLGGHWSIETDLNNPTDPENRTLSALLVWSLRY